MFIHVHPWLKNKTHPGHVFVYTMNFLLRLVFKDWTRNTFSNSETVAHGAPSRARLRWSPGLINRSRVIKTERLYLGMKLKRILLL